MGQTIAFVLIGWGIVNVLSGNFVGGLWTALIGWFLNSSAEGARQQVSVQNLLGGVPVSSIMYVSPETASPELLVREFMLEHALRRGQRALPVLDNGHLLGIVSITDATCWRRDLSTIVRQGYAMTIRQVEDGALADGVNAALPTECCRG
jgi:hypothetical protein